MPYNAGASLYQFQPLPRNCSTAIYLPHLRIHLVRHDYRHCTIDYGRGQKRKCDTNTVDPNKMQRTKLQSADYTRDVTGSVISDSEPRSFQFGCKNSRTNEDPFGCNPWRMQEKKRSMRNWQPQRKEERKNMRRRCIAT